ncbi:MAG: hypothetical protein GXP29_08715 [Planctomycetes bacterium]|nr:hypothetical protein [Planctomycetota bacterium]
MNRNQKTTAAELMANSSDQSVSPTLEKLRRRQRMRNTICFAVRGTFYGAMAATLASLGLILAQPDALSKLVWFCTVGIPVGGLLGGLFGLTCRVNDLHVARALDRAANGEDRFASAVQLLDHPHKSRARLVLEDALLRTSGTQATSAIPIKAPAELKWISLPVALLACIILLVPNSNLAADEPAPPDVSSEEWVQVNEELRQELAEFPAPETPEEKKMLEQLKRLAEQLEKNPSKKEALMQIAQLRAKLQNHSESSGADGMPMKQAAQAMKPAEALAKLSALLKRGQYKQAANELASLADRLMQDNQRLSASDFEAISADFDAMAAALASQQSLAKSCRQCANAASSMNRQSLADALKRLSKNLRQDASKLRRCDNVCRSKSLLNRLSQRLRKCNGNKCKKCSNRKSEKCKSGKCNGSGTAFVRQSNKKGGLRAGWGTSNKWDGGGLFEATENRVADTVSAEERNGEDSLIQTVSPDERASSAQSDRDRYIDLIRKAEADLELETVPLAYRDYLRGYFMAIKPTDGSSGQPPDSRQPVAP